MQDDWLSEALRKRRRSAAWTPHRPLTMLASQSVDPKAMQHIAEHESVKTLYDKYIYPTRPQWQLSPQRSAPYCLHPVRLPSAERKRAASVMLAARQVTRFGLGLGFRTRTTSCGRTWAPSCHHDFAGVLTVPRRRVIRSCSRSTTLTRGKSGVSSTPT
ncbi:hypothetical protein Ait01nite_019710 [Actinoplanes italicus]|nr:hypothetical protein Ait01nite_019710 [Actinoplanes italicus]